MEPMFGHSILSDFMLAPEFINLNHGSFGALPHTIQKVYNTVTEEVERNPDHFIRRKLGIHVAEVQKRLAALVGAGEDECVVIPNVTHGIFVILRSMAWSEGDVLVHTPTAFPPIQRNVNTLPGVNQDLPKLSSFHLAFPESHASILERFQTHIRALKRGGSKVVALFDSIVSCPGVIMPWKQMVRICREEGVISIVDAAHSLGQERNIDLNDVQPDFWVANCSKWLYAKRGSGLLYVPKRNQHLISHNLPAGLRWLEPDAGKHTLSAFASEFHWNGSTDVALALTIGPALDYRASLGGEDRIIQYCHNLAVNGGRRLAEILNTEVMDTNGELTGCMANVRLPLSTQILSSPDIAREFDRQLFEVHGVYASIYRHNDKWWARVSAQIYNEISDFEKLGRVLLEICPDLEARFAPGRSEHGRP
ncbi:aminotransferase family protein [Moniliophthora roreri MCA 2997]|uniref:Aminotransferase family protein n=1 Tax=Moniliophthora roreri (strain MCA 2997) TaxID=1381753 RepID=V2Y0N8_MONRO|nr:aminotransferase family protein [Moniliophthora roreri MCA 2997]